MKFSITLNRRRDWGALKSWHLPYLLATRTVSYAAPCHPLSQLTNPGQRHYSAFRQTSWPPSAFLSVISVIGASLDSLSWLLLAIWLIDSSNSGKCNKPPQGIALKVRKAVQNNTFTKSKVVPIALTLHEKSNIRTGFYICTAYLFYGENLNS